MFDALERDVPADSDSPEAIVANAMIGSKLSRAMEELSEMERVCFVLKHLEQWRIAEIAEELGISISAAKQAVFRAVKKLRSRMTDIKSTGS